MCVYGFDGLTCGDKLGLLHVHKSKHGRPRKKKKKFKKKKKKKKPKAYVTDCWFGQTTSPEEIGGSWE